VSQPNGQETGETAPASGGATGEMSVLLRALARGEAGASEALFPRVYGELRGLAGALFRGNVAHTLQPTAVVHEAYLKLAGADERAWTGREHFFALAARAMRQVLVDHARGKGAEKRGAGWERVSLGGVRDSDASDVSPGDAGLVDLELALEKLEAQSERLERTTDAAFAWLPRLYYAAVFVIGAASLR